MGRNRGDLERDLVRAAGSLVDEKGYASFVEVMMRLDALSGEDHESWRFGRVPCLERVVRMNLSKVNHLLRAFAAWAKRASLEPSVTDYRKWGKGPKHPLRFTKSGEPAVERAWATHYVPARKDEAPAGAGAPPDAAAETPDRPA